MTTSIGQPKMIGSNGGAKRKKRKPCARSMSRTLALEQAYVHDVYSLIASSGEPSTPVHSHVKQFIVDEFEPGSVLLDIGCSDGKYLNLSPDIVVVGLEHCSEWFGGESYKSKPNSKHLVVGDVMYLPFHDELFDGILCCSVLHHLSTLERRISALKEIARIMKIGGKVLLTVTSGQSDVKDLESQDVLIRVDRNDKQFGSALNNFSGSDFDSKSYSSSTSSSSSSTNSTFELNVYDNCASSPTNSEFENCYSFVKKALKRFSLTSSIYSMKNSFSDGSSKSKFSNNLSLHDEMYPIELRNLDENSSSQCSSRSSSTTGDSALSSFNRSSSGCISQTSSNNIFPTSLLSVIKEHLISWKVQFTNSIVWNSLDAKTASLGEDGQARPLFEGIDQSSHRFSLPISLRNGPKVVGSTRSSTVRNSKNKHKVYASNGITKPLHNFAIDGVVKQVELNLSHVILPKKREEQSKGNHHVEAIAIATVSQSERGNSLTVKNKIIFQKSFSSESSRQTSFECSGYKLIAYYSMPELRTISARPESEVFSSTISQLKASPSVSHLHSLETVANFEPLQPGGRSDTPSSLQSDSKECLLTEIDDAKSECDYMTVENAPLSVSPASEMSDVSKECEIESAIADEMKENPSTLQHANSGKFTKKLLRQRSFSADYQPETVKFQPELPRRFSASPNIGTHRYNSNSHTPHHQQISIDSEESFVTIIPAIRSTRDSMADVATASDGRIDFDLEEEDDLASNQDLSPNEIDHYDSSDDDAYCESLSSDQPSDDNTSISSVLEATIKSVSKSDSKDSNCAEELPAESSPEDEEVPNEEQQHNSTVQSPPPTLHRYFHLYRSGELESLIEEHVQNLHIIDSFYNEYATSWCIVAEKIHVWTI